MTKANILNKNNKSHNQNDNSYRLIVSESPNSPAAESYRCVKVNIELLSSEDNVQVIQICSSSPSEGKTTTLLNLAATFAENNKKVLVIDLDFRKPKIHRAFNAENKNGIVDCLIGKLDISKAIHKSDIGIDYIPRGSRTEYPTVLLGTQKLKSIIEKLRGEYDYIFIDEPPVLNFSDCCIISTFCDCALYVISQNTTNRSEAKKSLNTLRKYNIKVLGAIYIETMKKEIYKYYNYKQEK